MRSQLPIPDSKQVGYSNSWCSYGNIRSLVPSTQLLPSLLQGLSPTSPTTLNNHLVFVKNGWSIVFTPSNRSVWSTCQKKNSPLLGRMNQFVSLIKAQIWWTVILNFIPGPRVRVLILTNFLSNLRIPRLTGAWQAAAKLPTRGFPGYLVLFYFL